jgi:protein-L-isoaspartate(D-aspartate) O-methyltransferase
MRGRARSAARWRPWVLAGLTSLVAAGIVRGASSPPSARAAEPAAQSQATGRDEYADRRARMVRDQIEARGVADPRVLAAMRRVPRHLFVPEALRSEAYEDYPLPIGHDQTISQPAIVALMTNALRLSGEERVLEIGTGSGYQAAVLSLLCRAVYSIEIVEPLGTAARTRLERLGYRNVQIRIGDGYRGWPEAAPFDRIILTAAPDDVPQALVAELRPGGILVAPIGKDMQVLVRWTKTERGIEKERLGAVRFVPMVPGTR